MNKLYKIIFSIMIVFSVFSCLLIVYLNNEYSKDRYEFINQVIYNVNKYYPNSEEDVVSNILNNKESKDILIKYGIDEYNNDFSINNRFKSKVIIFVIIISIVTSVLIIIIIYTYIKNHYRKIRELNKYTEDVLNDKYSLDIRDNSEEELSILKNKIYDMTIALKEKNIFLDENKKEFEKLIADISHQLKTPLTSLNLINELLYTDMPYEKRKQFLKDMSSQLEKIQWQVKTLLNIAKLDSKTLILKKDNVNSYEMCKKCVDNFSILCEVKEIEMKVDKEDIFVNCDEIWTMESINNILKNAIEHDSKNVVIHISKNKLYTEIIIQDDGEGIDKEDIPHIFDRFYKSKNSKSGSLGLGLAFTKSIIQNQNGDIRINSIKGKGTKFIIKLYD